MSDEGLGNTSSDCMTFLGAGPLSSLTDTPSQRSVAMSASVTVIPPLPEGRMGKGVSSSSLYLNLSTTSSGVTTAEAMEDSREVISKSKGSSLRSYHNTLGGIEFLVCEIFMTHDKCVGRWTHPPHHPKILPYKHQPLHTLPLICVRLLVTDEGGWVHHLGNC